MHGYDQAVLMERRRIRLHRTVSPNRDGFWQMYESRF